MKKKFILLVAAALLLPTFARALIPVFVGDLTSGAVCVDSNYQIDLNDPVTAGGVPQRIDQSAWQANYSSTTFATKTFTDGGPGSGSITVATNSGFTQVRASNTITLGSTASLAAQKATNTITVASNTALTGAVLTVNGAQFIEGRDWTKASTSTGTAVALRAALASKFKIDWSTGAGSVVFGTATVAGLAGNNFTITSSTPAALTVRSLNFTGGTEQALTAATLTVDGTVYRGGYDWKIAATSSETATNIASLLNVLSGIDATSVGTTVFATATVYGAAGNVHTLVASIPTAMVIPQANFTGGTSTTTVTINGVTLSNGSDWATGSTSSGTAKNISNAIMANSSLNTVVRSTWSAAGVVTATATFAGTASNLSLATNSTALTVSGSAFTGGTNSAYVVNTPTIAIASNGFSTGLGVLYSTSSSTGITGLTNQTTYFVGVVDSGNFKLASSRSNAIAGTFITLASSSTTGPHTFTLTPVGITGTASFKWQISLDASNWTDLSVSSVSLTSPYTAASTYWDLGVLNGRYLRAKETAPTTGCWTFEIIGNGLHAAP